MEEQINMPTFMAKEIEHKKGNDEFQMFQHK